MKHIFLYGPPAVGKSTLSRLLANKLNRPHYDLDEEIIKTTGLSIADIFNQQGEAAFRKIEHQRLATLLLDSVKSASVISLGGGALINPNTRALAEQNGQIVLLTASTESLIKRAQKNKNARPLLSENLTEKLIDLIKARTEHYQSFSLQIDTTAKSNTKVLKEVQRKLGIFRVSGMGSAYDVVIQNNSLINLGELIKERSLRGPIVLISDENVAPLYAQIVLDSLIKAGFTANLHSIPAGENHKNLATVASLWDFFLARGLERKSTVVALGGGVVSDLVGFAAATYLRGINWVCIPTTLLAMADAAIGGKTGFDLPQGKNLIGAFHPPTFILADPSTLNSLPTRELRAGLAEVIKSAVIADKDLFNLLQAEIEISSVEQFSTDFLKEIITRAAAVKINIIEQDPYEKSLRAALNFGHTLGHAIEVASGFSLLHGEAISIGMVLASEMAERLGVARPGFSHSLNELFIKFGLPTKIPPEIQPAEVIRLTGVDKKKSAGVIKFVLPVKVGLVKTGVDIPNWQSLIFGE